MDWRGLGDDGEVNVYVRETITASGKMHHNEFNWVYLLAHSRPKQLKRACEGRIERYVRGRDGSLVVHSFAYAFIE